MGAAENNVAKYVAKQPDASGYIEYTEQENAMWAELVSQQWGQLEGRACQEYIDGLKRLAFPHDRIPQCDEVSQVLTETTGWKVKPVEAVIGFTEFFDMLANKEFPAATFIRNHDEVEYLQEPDIFHEFFGHTPLLTNPQFAEFVHRYGKIAAAADPGYHGMLARLFWFTVEFGLIHTDDGIRAYGAGILSSPKEVLYATESDVPQRKPFEPVDMLRTRYRIDILQPVFFCLNSFDELFALVDQDLLGLIDRARALGMHAPLFEPKPEALSA